MVQTATDCRCVRILQLLDQSSSTHHITHMHIRMCIEKMGSSNLVDSFRTTKPQQNLPYIHPTIPYAQTPGYLTLYTYVHMVFSCLCVCTSATEDGVLPMSLPREGGRVWPCSVCISLCASCMTAVHSSCFSCSSDTC